MSDAHAVLLLIAFVAALVTASFTKLMLAMIRRRSPIQDPPREREQ